MVLLYKDSYDDEYIVDTYINSLDANNDWYAVADLVGGSWIDESNGYKYVFRADGTFTEIDYGSADDESQGYYGINGNRLRTFDSKGYSYTYRIISLQKEKELILLDEKGDTFVFSYKKQ